MADYSADIASAQIDIAEAGCEALIVRSTDEFPIFALISDYSPQERSGSTGNTGLIQFTDKKILIAGGLGVIPDAETDQFKTKDIEPDFPPGLHRIVTVKPLAPSGTAIIYELQVRL